MAKGLGAAALFVEFAAVTDSYNEHDEFVALSLINDAIAAHQQQAETCKLTFER